MKHNWWLRGVKYRVSKKYTKPAWGGYYWKADSYRTWMGMLRKVRVGMPWWTFDLGWGEVVSVKMDWKPLTLRRGLRVVQHPSGKMVRGWEILVKGPRGRVDATKFPTIFEDWNRGALVLEVLKKDCRVWETCEVLGPREVEELFGVRLPPLNSI